jgi:type VI secretion system secreted protein VgrG
VIVDFVEGDPDQPIIVGSVYNADMMPPYDLPANKTQSGVRSRSSLSGSPANYNEIRFEDKKGAEQLLVHAERNQDIEVEKDETHWVGHDRKKTIDHDETTKVGNDRTETVTNNETITVDRGNRTVTLNMGNESLTIKMGNQTTQLQLGNQSTKIDLGKSETEALQSIELTVGQSSIKLDQMGVTIKGMMIDIEGQIQTQVKGVMTQVNADAILTLKGGLTMIG